MKVEMPRYRVKVAFRFYRVGDVIQPPAMLRNDLLRRGWVEPVVDEGPVPEVEPEKPKRRRRKRKDSAEEC